MVKKRTIGKVQLWIGILLIVVSIISMIYVKKMHENEININSAEFFNEVKYLQTQNVTNDETRLITANGISQNYHAKDSYIQFRFLILESTLLVILVVSILFITQGLVNKSGKK